MSGIDRLANTGLRRARRLAEPEESPADLMLLAAALLDQHGSRSSEARTTAERLRRLAQPLAAAQRASALFRGASRGGKDGEG